MAKISIVERINAMQKIIDEQKQRIEELEERIAIISENEPYWVEVSDYLPDDCVMCWLCDEGSSSVYRGFRSYGQWFDTEYNVPKRNVKWWMRIDVPDAPKEENGQ